MIFFNKKIVELGNGPVIVYTLFEFKKFGGILFHNFKTIEQDRYHDHAFSAIAFLLWGGYEEEQLIPYTDLEGRPAAIIKYNIVNQWLKPRWIPRKYMHRILKAQPNTWTVLFFGPWKATWREYFPILYTTKVYSWGRKVIKEYHGLV
jgi:hypothetical protein